MGNEYTIEIERLDKQSEKSEIRMNKFEEQMGQLRLDLQESSILTKQCIKSMDKFAETVDNNNTTMQKISFVMEQLVKSQEDLEGKLENSKSDSECKISEINKRIDCQDDKGKFDFIVFVKSNFVTICLIIVYTLDKLGIIK